MHRVALLLASTALAACASAVPSVPVFEAEDPAGDIRLTHPAHPDIQAGTFDLRWLAIAREGDYWLVSATFAAPVRRMAEVRLSDDRPAAVLPQTIDIYLDTTPEQGRVHALPGRGFHLPAAEAWDRVLVISSIDDLTGDGIVRPIDIVAQGRSIRARFAVDDLPDLDAARGWAAVILATSPQGEGRVREVSRSAGDCHVWNDARCTLGGQGPAVLDATVAVTAGRPVALSYPKGDRPTPQGVSVVFERGPLLGVAPVDATQVSEGQLATLRDAEGRPVGTAIVLSVIGDTASLQRIGDAGDTEAATVVFAGGPQE